MAELTVWLLVALPSITVAVLVAYLRYGFSYTFDWPLLVASSVLIAVTATAVGYAIAVSLPPLLAQLTTQVLVFFAMLFSPITFPASRLPAWFQSLHDVLPVRPAADLLRAGLVSGTYSASWRDLAVLVIWCVLGLAVSVLLDQAFDDQEQATLARLLERLAPLLVTLEDPSGRAQDARRPARKVLDEISAQRLGETSQESGQLRGARVACAAGPKGCEGDDAAAAQRTEPLPARTS